MVKVLKLSDLDEKVQDFLNGIDLSKNDYLVEANGKTLLGVVSSNEIERKKRFEVIDRVWDRNKNVPFQEIINDVEAAVDTVRTL